MSVEPCTTEGRRKRHLSLDLKPDRHAPREPGMGGHTLCGYYAIDEERANAPRKMWAPTGYEFIPRKKRLTVADLPECGSCRRSQAARAEQ